MKIIRAVQILHCELNLLHVLDMLNVPNVLDVLNMPTDSSLACWTLFIHKSYASLT